MSTFPYLLITDFMNAFILSRDLFPLIGRILCKMRRIQNALKEDCAVRRFIVCLITVCFFLLKQGTKILVNN